MNVMFCEVPLKLHTNFAVSLRHVGEDGPQYCQHNAENEKIDKLE